MRRESITALRHLWLDESDARRAVSAGAIERLTRRIAHSEMQHSGEVRVFIEASLPATSIWRHWRYQVPLDALCRERALAVFGDLRVWDTEQNNGVLLYLLLAERRIELIADRGINAVVDPVDWQAMVAHMGAAFTGGAFEAGLMHALDELEAPLTLHFALRAGERHHNELPDAPRIG